MATTANPHIGLRLRYAMRRTGLRNTRIADACGVTSQAVSVWKRTGKIDKAHLPVLARLSGYPIEWWIDPLLDLDASDADQLAGGADRAQQFVVQLLQELTTRQVSEESSRMLLAMVRALPPKQRTMQRQRIDVPSGRRSGEDRRRIDETYPGKDRRDGADRREK